MDCQLLDSRAKSHRFCSQQSLQTATITIMLSRHHWTCNGGTCSCAGLGEAFRMMEQTKSPLRMSYMGTRSSRRGSEGAPKRHDAKAASLTVSKCVNLHSRKGTGCFCKVEGENIRQHCHVFDTNAMASNTCSIRTRLLTFIRSRFSMSVLTTLPSAVKLWLICLHSMHNQNEYISTATAKSGHQATSQSTAVTVPINASPVAPVSFAFSDPARSIRYRKVFTGGSSADLCLASSTTSTACERELISFIL